MSKPKPDDLLQGFTRGFAFDEPHTVDTDTNAETKCGAGEILVGGGYFVGGPATSVNAWAATASYPRFAPPLSSWGWVADGWNNGGDTVLLTSRALCAR